MDESEALRRWRRIKELVDAALELPPAARMPFLREQCAEEALPLAVAEPLLRASEAARSRLENVDPTASAGPPPVAPQPSSFEPGSHVGPYVIVGRLGSGGFGDVYLAERMHPVRQGAIALKVIQPLASREAIHHFAREQQALALMNHPGIAWFLGADFTSDGRPYFAMEHVVPGEWITRHCDRQRLGIRQRIELVILVCEAVQSAHQKLIIHRDLKPANILVKQEKGQPAQPKVIDFGLAKALYQPLVATAPPTELGQLLGTVGYMAPEQAKPTARGVDIRADVYSLGVILYELLAGRLPFELEGLGRDDAIGITCNVEPPTSSSRFAALLQKNAGAAQKIAAERDTHPKALIRTLRRDLDWITLKCLEKAPERRYDGVDQLIDDLRQYLALKPVRAGRPSMTYRARKFVRRHRGAVVSTTLIGAAVIGGLTLWVKEAATRRELKRRDNQTAALQQLDVARTLFLRSAGDERLGFELDSIADSSSTESFRAQLEEALELAIRDDPALVDAQILRIQARLLDGDRAAAIDMARDARLEHPDSKEVTAALMGLMGAGPERDVREEKLIAHGVCAEQLLYFRAITSDDPYEAIRLLEECIAASPWHFDANWQLAVRYGAVNNGFAMLRVADVLTRAHPEIALPWVLRGNARIQLGDMPAAEADLSEAIRIDGSAWRPYYDRAVARHLMGCEVEAEADVDSAHSLAPDNGEIHALHGAVLAKKGELQGAVTEYHEALRRGTHRWWVRADRGDALRLLGRDEEALADLDATLAHADGLSRDALAQASANRGALLLWLRRLDVARADLDLACALQPSNEWNLRNFARLHRIAGRHDEAIRVYDEALRVAPGSGADLERGIAFWFSGDVEGARRTFQRWASRDEYHWVHLWIWDLEASLGNRARAAAALDAAEQADLGSDAAFTSVIRVLRGLAQPAEVEELTLTDPERLYAYYVLGAQARIQGRRDDASTWYRRAMALHVDEAEREIVEHEAGTL